MSKAAVKKASAAKVAPESSESKVSEEEISVQHVKLGSIAYSKFNPRKIILKEETQELADSIGKNGLLQPVCLRPKDQKYEIVSGERRVRACRLLGLKTIPAIVREYSDEEAEKAAILENLQRVDVHPLDEAHAFASYIENHKCSAEEVAAMFGKNAVYIRNRIRLDALIPEFKKMLKTGKIEVMVALFIAKQTEEMQKTVYEEHFVEDDYSSWADKSYREIRNIFEREYATNLSSYDFDKKDCMECPSNSKCAELDFGDRKEGMCLKLECLNEKNLSYKVNAAVELLNSSGAIGFNRYEWGSDKELVQRLESMGYEISNVESLSPMPDLEADDSRDAEWLKHKKAEIKEKLAQDKILIYVNILQRGLEIAYCEKQGELEGETSVRILSKKIDRNKEIAQEKIIVDSVKQMQESDIAEPLDEFEQEAMFFFMMDKLLPVHKPLFGGTQSGCGYCFLYPKTKAERVKSLTNDEKFLIIRDFIVSSCGTPLKNSPEEGILIGMMERHHSDKLKDIQEKHNAVRDKRNERLKERIAVEKTRMAEAKSQENEESELSE